MARRPSRGAGPAAGATGASRADANDAAPARPLPRRPAVGPASARPRPSLPGLPSASVRLWRLAARCAPSLQPGRRGLCSGTPPRPFGAAASAPLASAPPSPPPHAGSDMAHAAVRCPSARGSGDGEMGKPRKVALITGITGQVSAEAGVRAGPAAARARVRPALAAPCVSRNSLLGIPEGFRCGLS